MLKPCTLKCIDVTYFGSSAVCDFVVFVKIFVEFIEMVSKTICYFHCLGDQNMSINEASIQEKLDCEVLTLI